MVSLELQWKQLLWDCYKHGRVVKKDDSNIKEILGNYVFIERPQDIGTPFRKENDNVKDFLTDMKKGLYNINDYPIKNEALHKYVSSFYDINHISCSDPKLRKSANIDTDPFVYTYPERLQHIVYNTNTDMECFNASYQDQIGTIIERLVNNQGSNRAVATLYHPGIDRKRIDIPCLNFLQAIIRRNKLELHCFFRSNDLYGAFPSNMYFITLIGLHITENINKTIQKNITFNGIHYHSSSLHIYETDLDMVKNILGE